MTADNPQQPTHRIEETERPPAGLARGILTVPSELVLIFGGALTLFAIAALLRHLKRTAKP